MAGKRVFALRGSTNDRELEDRGFVFDPDLAEYFEHPSPDNLRNLVRRAFAITLDPDLPWRPARPLLRAGIWHPGTEEPFPEFSAYLDWYRTTPAFASDRPWLGLMIFPSFLAPGQREALDALAGELEAGGFNLLPAFGGDLEMLERFFLDSERKSRVDLILGHTLKFNSALAPELAAALAELDVPVFNAIQLYSQTLAEWRASPVGIEALDAVWSLGTPEISGAIEPTPLGGKVEEEGEGGTSYRQEPLPEQVRRLLPRLRRWAALRRRKNSDKRLAILYYNHSQGKQNLGASYLNLFRSLEEIIGGLARAGYDIPPAARLKERELAERALAGGLNIGTWAPGELDRLLENGGAEELPLEEYLAWFAELPREFRDKVLEQWGEPGEASLMFRNGRLIIPLIRLGEKLVVLPEPVRGLADDPRKLYHDPHLYPHHQYLAAYLWLERRFRADAVIHLGTHASYEWLPGKQAGLSPACPPEIMLGELPNLYPYLVDDLGEGVQAKRRGRGVIIDHLTPALGEAEGRSEHIRLRELAEAYRRAESLASPTAPGYLERVRALAERLGLGREAGRLDGPEGVNRLLTHLEKLELEVIPYGLHTFGRSPEGEALAGTAAAVAAANPGWTEAAAAGRLSLSGPNEMEMLLRGLAGRYIPPGEGNDPLRNPASLPTGRNFHGFPPDRLPSRAAWELGQKAAGEIIAGHRRENRGKYPEKAAVVLWAVETLRNEGINEAAILALAGMEPVWDPGGRVTGVRPIPPGELGRPRIDVTVNASGLYRDLFPEKIRLLDGAIRQAAALGGLDNFISRNDRRLEERLLASGMAPGEAGRLARARIFSEAPGAYGNRVAELVSASGLWEDEGAVAEVYLRQGGFAYGGDFWGLPAETALAENLAGAEIAWHSQSSNLFGLMDSDDAYMYLGGMNLAIRRLSGRNPETLIADQRRPGSVVRRRLGASLAREAHRRYLNPKWMEAMMGENYAGAREMSNYVDYLWGWQVTSPGAVDGELWDQTFAAYVEDRFGLGLKEFFGENNPWAFQSLTGRMLEAIRKGYWSPGEGTARTLAAEYALNVAAKGVACCDHTCNNPLLNQMVANLISLPGLPSPELAVEFRLAMERAAGKELGEQVRERLRLLEELGRANPSPRPDDPAGGDPGETRNVRGFKMEPVEQAEDSAVVGSSGMEWFAPLFVLAILALFFGGFRRARR
ncbi:MAG: cobaltochelatase subunit CobN [Planctomycetota bacterium]|nr:cobaltochelatase subunit CobN [Planctomycetota bacterium]